MTQERDVNRENYEKLRAQAVELSSEQQVQAWEKELDKLDVVQLVQKIMLGIDPPCACCPPSVRSMIFGSDAYNLTALAIYCLRGGDPDYFVHGAGAPGACILL